MSWLGTLLLGKGTLRASMRAQLEREGLVLVEEGLGATIRYRRFRAPGRYHHGKIVAERVAIGISRKRVVMFCRNGRAKLVNSEYDSPHLRALDVSAADDGGAVVFHVDYGKLDQEKVSGEIEMRVRTPNARRIAGEVNARLGRAAADAAR
jgi:hypothetical protein